MIIIIDFDKVVDRRGTDSEKWNKYAGRDIIPMWVADMDFQCAPEIQEQLKQRIEHGVFGYGECPEELVDVTVKWVHDRYGWSIEREWIVWQPGLVSAFNLACRAFVEEGQEVSTFVPVYPPFLHAPSNGGRKLVKSRLKNEDGRFTFDIEDFKKKISAETKLLLLCSPQNPVGRSYSKEELEAVVNVCVENDIIICSDEIHCDLVLDEKRHLPTAMVSSEAAERTITLMAPSKTFNIPGLCCAFAVIKNDELRRRFVKEMRGIQPCVNVMGYCGAIAAFRDCEYWRQELLGYLRGNRDLVYEFVNGFAGMSMSHVEATYLAWIDVRGLGLSEPVKFFEEAGVGFQDGADFDGDGFMRLNFGCPRSVLTEAFERIEKALNSR